MGDGAFLGNRNPKKIGGDLTLQRNLGEEFENTLDPAVTFFINLAAPFVQPLLPLEATLEGNFIPIQDDVSPGGSTKVERSVIQVEVIRHLKDARKVMNRPK